MDVMSLVATGAQMLGVDQSKAKQAANQALPYLNQVQTKQQAIDAMQAFGMDGAFLNKAIAMLDRPKAKMAQGLATMAGVDVAGAINGVKSLQSDVPAPTYQPSAKTNNGGGGNDPLAALRAGLQRRK